MTGYTVYLDQVILGNLVMNYIILWATARLSRVSANKMRLLSGSALGALYVLTVFLPGLNFLLATGFKIAVSFLIILAAFAPLPPARFFTCLGCFYLTSFALGGLVFGFIFFLHSGPLPAGDIGGVLMVIGDYFWYGTLLALLAFWAAVRGYTALMRSRLTEGLFKMVLKIGFWDRQIEVKALLDTGNRLSDPMTMQPVIIVEYDVLKPVLPPVLQQVLASPGDPVCLRSLESLSESRWSSRFCLIPFQSLGRDGGLLAGFRPDTVEVVQGRYLLQFEKAVIAVYHKRLDPEGSYHALLPPDLLTTGRKTIFATESTEGSEERIQQTEYRSQNKKLSAISY